MKTNEELMLAGGVFATKLLGSADCNSNTWKACSLGYIEGYVQGQLDSIEEQIADIKNGKDIVPSIGISDSMIKSLDTMRKCAEEYVKIKQKIES